MQVWTSYITPLSLYFLICKIRTRVCLCVVLLLSCVYKVLWDACIQYVWVFIVLLSDSGSQGTFVLYIWGSETHPSYNTEGSSRNLERALWWGCGWGFKEVGSWAWAGLSLVKGQHPCRWGLWCDRPAAGQEAGGRGVREHSWKQSSISPFSSHSPPWNGVRRKGAMHPISVASWGFLSFPFLILFFWLS